eukprot:g19313.t1
MECRLSLRGIKIILFGVDLIDRAILLLIDAIIGEDFRQARRCVYAMTKEPASCSPEHPSHFWVRQPREGNAKYGEMKCDRCGKWYKDWLQEVRDCGIITW